MWAAVPYCAVVDRPTRCADRSALGVGRGAGSLRTSCSTSGRGLPDSFAYWATAFFLSRSRSRHARHAVSGATTCTGVKGPAESGPNRPRSSST